MEEESCSDALTWLVAGASKPHGASRPSSAGTLLFLDIDGVLNTGETHDLPAEYVIHTRGWPCLLSVAHLHRLREVLEASACDVVLSSTWRLNELGCRTLERGLCAAGIPCDRIVGATPDLRPHGSRPDEILAWLRAHGGGAVWAAIDDMPLEREQPEGMRGHCVLTSIDTGLDADAAHACICLLNQQQRPTSEAHQPVRSRRTSRPAAAKAAVTTTKTAVTEGCWPLQHAAVAQAVTLPPPAAAAARAAAPARRKLNKPSRPFLITIDDIPDKAPW
jgi:hypothetical protein